MENSFQVKLHPSSCVTFMQPTYSYFVSIRAGPVEGIHFSELLKVISYL